MPPKRKLQEAPVREDDPNFLQKHKGKLAFGASAIAIGALKQAGYGQAVDPQDILNRVAQFNWADFGQWAYGAARVFANVPANAAQLSAATQAHVGNLYQQMANIPTVLTNTIQHAIDGNNYNVAQYIEQRLTAFAAAVQQASQGNATAEQVEAAMAAALAAGAGAQNMAMAGRQADGTLPMKRGHFYDDDGPVQKRSRQDNDDDDDDA